MKASTTKNKVQQVSSADAEESRRKEETRSRKEEELRKKKEEYKEVSQRGAKQREQAEEGKYKIIYLQNIQFIYN
jgi:hypothetical protein